MYKDQNKLIESLIAKGLLDLDAAEDVRKKAKETKKTPEELLIADKKIDEEKLTEIKGELLNTPVVNLKGEDVASKVLKLIPREVAENYQMVAFKKAGKELQVGLVNPQNFKALEAVEFLAQKSNLEVKYFLISAGSFKEAFRKYQVLGEEVEQALAGIGKKVLADKAGLAKTGNMEEVVKSAPVSKMVLVIFKHAVDGRASDIHIEPSMKDTKVRYRIDGMLRTSLVLPKYIHSAIVARIKVLANLRLDESRKPQDGRIRINMEGRNIDFRVSTLPLFEGEKVVLRILDTSNAIPTLDKLGFNSVHSEIIKEGTKKPHGLFLLTGPTGSGKTTTLYTILTMLNQDGINIVTLEDPIEYYIDGINQSQINTEVDYTFASGLRAILRQDPNIVMLGEIRDEETTQLVVHASLTGHMVLSTLHTNSAIGAIPRLIDLGAEPFLLSSVLNIIIAQRLARKICPDCKNETAIPPNMVKRVKEKLESIPKDYLEGIDITKPVFHKGKGCARCGNLGYKGRVAVSEIIKVTRELSEVIANEGNRAAIEAELKKQNFITLTQDCLLKALDGQTTLDEVMRISQL